MIKRIRFLLLIIIFLFLITELFLRIVLGFCDALLYQSSEKYEYIAQPNQKHYRFKAHIHYNSFSQRNEEPDTTKIHVLGLGDSVIFGGTWMDQKSIATTLFTEETGMQMLNISAGSWGPDNCAAYLQEYGVFEAQAMILVCSSHDAYDCMSFTPVVGIYPTYPKEQYKLAIWEAIERYFYPYIKKLCLPQKQKLDPDTQIIVNTSNTQIIKKSNFFNPGFEALMNIANSKQIPFAIYLHAEKTELEKGKYNEMGQEIIKWAHSNNIYLIQGIKTENNEMYHDIIHFNKKGQRHLANQLKEIANRLIKK